MRDLTVTGVQTCALPISWEPRPPTRSRSRSADGLRTPRACRSCWEPGASRWTTRSEEHTSELQSQSNLVCRLLLEKKKKRLPMLIQHCYERCQPRTYCRV